jgi:hypothetical protein
MVNGRKYRENGTCLVYVQTVIVPLRRGSRLLAPTVIPNVPLGLTQDWLVMSQMERSKRESVIETVFDALAFKSTSVKPLRICGGSPADSGWCR